MRIKKTLLVVTLFCAGLVSYPQTHEKIKLIANELNNYKTYQSVCEYTFSIPFGDTITTEKFITTKLIPSDKLSGFYYVFKTSENYKGVKSMDFTMYFDSIVYSSYLGKVKKTSYDESPSQFIEIKLENGFIPAVHKKTQYYKITPYEITKTIERLIEHPSMIVSQKPDTIIELDTCLRYILESKCKYTPFDRSNPEHWKEGKDIYELCFHKTLHFPVLYKYEVFTPIGNQIQIAHFRNTKINNALPENYFTEENLLPADWDKLEDMARNEKKLPDELIGKKAPKWVLPELGSDEAYSSNNLKGKTVLLEFTATWCAHCFRAAEMMNRLETEFENNDNVEIVSIYSSDLDTKESIERFVNRLNPKSTILYSATAVEKKFNIQGYPNFFIISPKGKIIKFIRGYGQTVEKDLIDALLKFTE